MQNQNSESARLLNVTVITPDCEENNFTCDSLHVTVPDGRNKNGGGSYGIRCGHAAAILALDNGRIEAFLKGETVWSGIAAEGFARVEADSVTIVTEELKPDE